MDSVAERNLAIVKQSYDAYKAGDWDGFFRPFDENIVVHEAASLPYGGEYRGIDELKTLSRRMLQTWEESSFNIMEFTAGGELVIVHFQMNILGRTTRKSFSFPVLELWRLKDEKVVEMRIFYWDTHKILEVFG